MGAGHFPGIAQHHCCMCLIEKSFEVREIERSSFIATFKKKDPFPPFHHYINNLILHSTCTNSPSLLWALYLHLDVTISLARQLTASSPACHSIQTGRMSPNIHSPLLHENRVGIAANCI